MDDRSEEGGEMNCSYEASCHVSTRSWTTVAIAMRESGAHVVFGQQARTELQVVVQIERPPGLEASAEGGHGGGLGQLLHAPHPTELPLRRLRRRQASATGASIMMGVGRGSRGRRVRSRIEVLVGGIVGHCHYYGTGTGTSSSAGRGKRVTDPAAIPRRQIDALDYGEMMNRNRE